MSSELWEPWEIGKITIFASVDLPYNGMAERVIERAVLLGWEWIGKAAVRKKRQKPEKLFHLGEEREMDILEKGGFPEFNRWICSQ